MSIKEEFVLVLVGVKTDKHYEDLGYPIPRIIDKWGRLIVKRGTKIWVKVEDLPKDSHVPITAICECPTCKHPERILSFRDYRDICNDCNNHSDDHRKLMVGLNKGRKHTEESNKKKSESHKGKKHSEETKRKMRAAHIGKNKGKDNPNFGKFGKDSNGWNPNKSDEERIKGRCIPGKTKWIKDVKERDNYTCQCCGFIGKENDGKLNAHHLNNYLDFPEQRLDINNGITLCVGCHSSANGYSYHTIRGRMHNTKEEFFRWFMWRIEFDNTEL